LDTRTPSDKTTQAGKTTQAEEESRGGGAGRGLSSGLRLAFITTDLDTGGAEVFLVDLLLALKQRGVRPLVISLRTLGTQGPRLLEADIPVQALNITSPLGFMRGAAGIRRHLRLFDAQLVQGWMYHGNIAASRACRSLGLPVYWSVHNTLGDLRGESLSVQAAIAWSRYLSARQATRPRAVHYCSRVAADQHRAYGFAETCQQVIPNGFDCRRFQPCPELAETAKGALGFAPKTPLIGMIGRYNPMKDHANFLRAAGRLHAQRPDVGFALIGKGVDEANPQLQEQRRQQGLGGSMRLLGERQDVQRLLPGLDVLSTASRAEAFPLVLGEAMAAGVACTATDVGDCRYLLGAAGLVVPPRSPEALAQAWMQLLSEPAGRRRARSRYARHRIQQQFSVEAVADRFLGMY